MMMYYSHLFFFPSTFIHSSIASCAHYPPFIHPSIYPGLYVCMYVFFFLPLPSNFPSSVWFNFSLQEDAAQHSTAQHKQTDKTTYCLPPDRLRGLEVTYFKYRSWDIEPTAQTASPFHPVGVEQCARRTNRDKHSHLSFLLLCFFGGFCVLISRGEMHEEEGEGRKWQIVGAIQYYYYLNLDSS